MRTATYLVDRRSDMIVTGGAGYSSAVVGLADDDLGQRIHAIVEAHLPVSEAELREHLAELLVRCKKPRRFEFVDTPLRGEAGKVRRSKLRDDRAAPERTIRGPRGRMTATIA